jgi:polysaccharide export outer membrane protein
MFRSLSLFAVLTVLSCFSGPVLAQTAVEPVTPAGPVTVTPSGNDRAQTDAGQPAESPRQSVRQDGSIRIGSGDLVTVTVYGAPDLTTEARVSSTGTITMPLIGSIHIGGLTGEEAQQLIAKRLRDRELIRDPQVSVFEKEYASGGMAVMGEVQKPGIYNLAGHRRLLDAISVAGGTTNRAGRAVTITHSAQPDQPTIVDLDYLDPSKSPAGNVELSPGDTVVVSRAGIVYVVGAVAKPAGFVMENNEKLTVLQAVAMAGGTLRTSSLKSAKILRGTPNGMQEIPIPLNKILEAKAVDPPLAAQDILFIPNSAGKQAALTAAQAAVAVATGLAIYRP